MRSKLRKEIILFLDELSTSGMGGINPPFGSYSSLRREAVEFLRENGAVKEIMANRYIITEKGYDYHEQLKSPVKYWLKSMALRFTGNLAWLAISNVITAAVTAMITFWITSQLQGS